MEIFGTGDFDGAELLEMGCDPLRVEENEAALSQVLDQAEKRHLRRLPDVVKHRFAKESTADGDPVKAAGEFAVLPRLHGMGVTQLVKPGVTGDNLIVDPGLGTPGA